jgi:hypothetical protein
MANFILTPKGVCVVSPAGGGEHTICGDAFDIASHEADYEWLPTAKKSVSCLDCIRIVTYLRGFHVEWTTS